MAEGFIALSRKFCEWEWYKDTNTKSVFLHLLIHANWKDGKFQGEDVPRGSMATSFERLSKDLGIEVQSVRTALKHLEKTGEITRKSTSRYQVINVVNYGKYQDLNIDANKVTNKQLTSNQQATNKQLTTIEQRNKETKKQYIYNNSDWLSVPMYVFDDSKGEYVLNPVLSQEDIDRVKAQE